eukprot:scaffold82842_cov48-Cyclotella_meneghiniana.AAC.2
MRVQNIAAMIVFYGTTAVHGKKKRGYGADCYYDSDCKSNSCKSNGHNVAGYYCEKSSALEWVKDNKVEEVNQADLPVKCKDVLYKVGLYGLSGSHFFIGGTVINNADNDVMANIDCPSAIAFASIDGTKKVYNAQETAVQELSNHFLGQFALYDILAAEENVTAIDNSGYHLTKNTCIHYAGAIWRALGVEETHDMADFLVTNLVDSDEFIEFAKMKAGGLRVVTAFAVGGKHALENYVRDIVTSQLNIVSTPKLASE